MTAQRTIRGEHFAQIYERFRAAISRYDCGKKCAPLNGGEPVCCSTAHAVPVADRAEWALLRGRSDLWRRFKPHDASTKTIVEELAGHCIAIECKGAAHCERDNRTIACRSFPFFPYITRAGEFVGLAYYWNYENLCWVISNLGIVERDFVREFAQAFETIFQHDPDEFTTMRDHSASMRRVFTRWRRVIPLIGRDGGYFKVLPRGGRIVSAKIEEFESHGPYRSDAAYARAVAKAGGAIQA